MKIGEQKIDKDTAIKYLSFIENPGNVALEALKLTGNDIDEAIKLVEGSEKSNNELIAEFAKNNNKLAKIVDRLIEPDVQDRKTLRRLLFFLISFVIVAIIGVKLFIIH